MGAWDEIDWDAPRPDPQDVIDSWGSVTWEVSSIDEPDLDLYVEELASVMTNGGVLLGRWKAVEYTDVTHWFMSRNRLEEYELHRLLFSSASFNEALPDLKVPAQLDRVPGALAEQWAGEGFWFESRWGSNVPSRSRGRALVLPSGAGRSPTVPWTSRSQGVGDILPP